MGQLLTTIASFFRYLAGRGQGYTVLSGSEEHRHWDRAERTWTEDRPKVA
jgi:hypothetical protein